MIKKTKSENIFHPPLPSSWAQLHRRFSLPPPTMSCRGGQGMGFVVGSSHSLFTISSSSCSSRVPAWDPSHKILSSTNFFNVGPSHRLQFFMNCFGVSPFHLSFPQCTVFQEETAPVWIPHGFTSPASKPGPVQASLSKGSRVLPGACSSADFPQGHKLFQTFPPALARAPPLRNSMGCRRATCITVVFSVGCRGFSAPMSGAPPPPPSSQTMLSAELFLSCIFTPLPQVLLCSRVFPPSLICYYKGTTTVTDWFGLGQ